MQAKNRCEYCGAILPYSVTACPNCGAPIEKIPENLLASEDSSFSSEYSLKQTSNNSSNAAQFLSQHAGYFHQDQLPYIKELLMQVNKTSLNEINTIKLYNPSTIRIISLLSGYLGVDRFILGQRALGLAKLIIFLILLFIIKVRDELVHNDMLSCEGKDNLEDNILLFFFCVFLWWAIDVFSSARRVKKYNFTKLTKLLSKQNNTL